MNKKALLDYALFARKELETQIAISLNKLGIYKNKIAKANVVGDITVIEGIQQTYPKRVYSLRENILNDMRNHEETFDHMVEEYAYTWFNRIIAIRFMEVHDYFSHGLRVLTSRDGSYEPEILQNIMFVVKELDLKESVVTSLKEQGNTEELYRYLLFRQCYALNKIFPELFSKDAEYLELLLPNNLLSQDSIIRKITIIPEEDFMNDVEIVGWLYQFYNSVKKDEVNASEEKITKETLPAVTQLFTPDWIVRYMAENSVGRLWLESYPESSIKETMNYYVDDAEQDEETIKKLDEIKYKNVNPETIKIIEPCCGSGHILVYVFDLLYKMYLEQGYNSKDIPGFILKNNLYGLDIDKRAAQLAQFSLIMKARSVDNRFFNNERFVKPKVYEIIDSSVLVETKYKENMKSLHFSNKSIELADYLCETFKYAKTIGSLLKVENKDYTELLEDMKRCRQNEVANLLEIPFYDDGIYCLRKLVRIAYSLARKYDVMITNPPYLPNKRLDDVTKKYVSENYNDSKTDMFAMFMETSFTKKNGFLSMINMHAWMFLDSYNKLRYKIISNSLLINMAHLGTHAFETIGGEVVQTTSFVIRNVNISKYNSKFYRLVNYDCFDKETQFLNKNNNVYIVNFKSIIRIPDYSFSYWMSQEALNAFNNYDLLGQTAEPKKGLSTGENDTFLRLWFEVDNRKINFSNQKDLDKKWVLLNKGGTFKKWYGNNDFIINWENNGELLKKFKGSVIRNEKYYFKESITWSMLSSSTLSTRYSYGGKIFEGAGPSLFIDHKYIYYILAVLCSKLGITFVKSLNPTLNININDIANIPLCISQDYFDIVSNLSVENVALTKKEWDSYENSYDFKGLDVKDFYSIVNWCNSCINRRNSIFESIKKNEETINSILLKIYKMDQIIDFKCSDNDITIRRLDNAVCIKNLISYMIGCLMGRYSLEQEGLVYAGGEFDYTKYGNYVDDDGILPIYKFIGIKDGLTKAICDLVKRIYGDTYYKENLDFIADALGRKIDEDAKETINRYLNENFYSDHLSMYYTKSAGSRPIYWMLSSGKQGAFKCLVYLHRYDKNTLAKINSKYFLPRTAMYKAERERLEYKLSTADAKERKKIEQDLKNVEACEQELLEYGQVLDHMANQYIDIDLDDGVKVNYVKFQNISLEVNGATIKKNLLVPFGLENEKKK